MRSSNRLVTIALILFITLLVANIWHFLVREKESSFYPTSYATLYYPSDIPTVREWKQVARNQIQVKIASNKKVNQWRIITDDTISQISTGNDPILNVFDDEGQLHTYTLIPLPEKNAPQIQFTIRFYSKEFYANRGLNHSDVYIIKTDAPCGKFKQYPVDYWIDDYNYVGEEGLAEVDRIIHEEIGIRDDQPTFSKMEKLTRFLR
ncbi:hypothetical protein EH221_00445, partial [bacterium]